MLGLAAARKRSIASYLSTEEDVVARKISGATQWQLAAAAKAILAAQKARNTPTAASVTSEKKRQPPKGFHKKVLYYLGYAYTDLELRKFVLFLILVIYAFIGGAIFYAVEHPAEVDSIAANTQFHRLQAKNMSQLMWDMCVNFTHNNSTFLNDTYNMITLYQDQTGLVTDKLLWTYWNAVFYSGVTFATIGYGDTTTKTFAGRIATMIYATIGIPLMLAALHDLGTFLTDLFKIFHKKILVRLSKRLCSKNKIAPENQKKPSEMGQNRISSETLRTPWHSFIDIRINQEAEDNISSFNYPIVVGIFIVIVWIVSCAAIFQPWEGWSLFDGIYFFFISLTTIGFGDIVPGNRDMMLIFFWLVMVGLAMVTVLVNLIQERIETLKDTASALLEKEIIEILAKINQSEEENQKRKETKHGRRNST